MEWLVSLELMNASELRHFCDNPSIQRKKPNNFANTAESGVRNINWLYMLVQWIFNYDLSTEILFR